LATARARSREMVATAALKTVNLSLDMSSASLNVCSWPPGIPAGSGKKSFKAARLDLTTSLSLRAVAGVAWPDRPGLA
jgi:hypothetical protein